ncbi:MAG: glutamate racemase [Kangiellaceae bacterium]|jgi:glutamate racemase|nr:glutamate racemase [Kangiellaceae bacterium]
MTTEILVFDSGIGGLTVWQEINQQLPQLCCHYLADNAFFPYGSKTEIEMEQRIEQLLSQTLKKHSIALVVIACNSASTAVLDYLRSQFDLPFVGVVPAIKPAAQLSKSKKIGLLATEGTVKRDYTQKLIDDFASDCQVTKVGSANLAAIAEQKMLGELVDHQKLAEIIQPLLDDEIDVGVLGCTHYPWLIEELNKLAPSVKWIDSASAIANRVASLVEVDNDNKQSQPMFYFTDSDTFAIKQLNTKFNDFYFSHLS